MIVVVLAIVVVLGYQLSKKNPNLGEVDDTIYEYVEGETIFSINYSSKGTTSDPPIIIITSLDETGRLKIQETYKDEDGEVAIKDEMSTVLSTSEISELMDQLLNENDYFAMIIDLEGIMVADGSTDSVTVKYNEIEKSFGGYGISTLREFRDVMSPFREILIEKFYSN